MQREETHLPCSAAPQCQREIEKPLPDVQDRKAARENKPTAIIGQKVRFVNMYKCSICGTVFDKPRVIRRTENLDGENGWEEQVYVVCPICGEQYFEESVLCPSCKRNMPADRIICKECAKKAKESLSDVLSQLDPAQVKYLDDELDGISLLDFWKKS